MPQGKSVTNLNYRLTEGRNTPLRHAAAEGAGGKHTDRVRFPIRGRIQLLTCNVQDRIGLLWVFLQRPDSFGCRQYANLTLRRCASLFTSSMTGNAPVPVPITSCRHFQGISSSY